MNILVCIKQVPSSSNVRVDPVTGVLIRDGADVKMNPYDLFALEMALQLRDCFGGKVDVLTMGPPQAKDVLLEAMYMGADDGMLLTDRRFAGADVVATSYTLSQGATAMGDYDLILCGKQTTDGDTAQVGAEMAEFLGIDHATNVIRIEKVTDAGLDVIVNFEQEVYNQTMEFPCLLTVEKDANVPRLPSYKRKKQVDPARVRICTLDDFADRDANHYGLSGSPTSVEKIFPPEKNDDRKKLSGTAAECADQLVALLADRRLI